MVTLVCFRPRRASFNLCLFSYARELTELLSRAYKAPFDFRPSQSSLQRNSADYMPTSLLCKAGTISQHLQTRLYALLSDMKDEPSTAPRNCDYADSAPRNFLRHDHSVDPSHALTTKRNEEYEVSFDNQEEDNFHPHHHSTWRRWTITLILSSGTMCVTYASAVYTTTYAQIKRDFGIPRELATVGLTTFVCGLGLGPMILSPLSEFYGRRAIYLVSFTLFWILLIPCALAENVQTMLIVRFLNGLAGSAFLSVAGGTIGDIFPREYLSYPMMVYTACNFGGPEVTIPSPLLLSKLTKLCSSVRCSEVSSTTT